MQPPKIESLRKRVKTVNDLPTSAKSLINHYLNLKVQGVKVSTPYHINCGLRSTKRALVGKGRPEEIEAVANKYLVKFHMLVKANETDKLRNFMLGCGIGVDCSGFVAWVMNEVTVNKLGKPISRCLKFVGSKRKIIGKIRPIENISANLLTSSLNTIDVKDLNEVKPGDLVRVINGVHVLVITEVGIDKNGAVKYFQFAQSSSEYGNQKGVSLGLTIVSSTSGDLSKQEWFSENAVDENLVKVLKANDDSNKIVRLRAL